MSIWARWRWSEDKLSFIPVLPVLLPTNKACTYDLLRRELYQLLKAESDDIRLRRAIREEPAQKALVAWHFAVDVEGSDEDGVSSLREVFGLPVEES